MKASLYNTVGHNRADTTRCIPGKIMLQGLQIRLEGKTGNSYHWQRRIILLLLKKKSDVWGDIWEYGGPQRESVHIHTRNMLFDLTTSRLEILSLFQEV